MNLHVKKLLKMKAIEPNEFNIKFEEYLNFI